jgi:hypothetical protein
MYSLSPRRNTSSYYDQRIIYAVGCFVEIESSLQCMNMQINGIRNRINFQNYLILTTGKNFLLRVFRGKFIFRHGVVSFINCTLRQI